MTLSGAQMGMAPSSFAEIDGVLAVLRAEDEVD
ncbi:MgtC/SapB family protein [Mycobacterium ahvazicum]|uniref:MgtC/SapB family protein n=1 Tax=Mycobacterium ahvazicum TaxID=1964395 RepID=A0A2K4YAB5_9MYCO|nr:MgtC/SapB family protein [Mycobacterium ahvazicum]